MKYKFKVSVIVSGKFHAFNLAEQLGKKNLLKSIITTYPKFIVKKSNIESNHIKSFFLKELIERLLIKLGLTGILKNIQHYLNLIFEIYAKKKIDYKSTDIIVGWSGCSEYSFLHSEQKKINCLKILERGSSHILFQNQILEEEFKYFKIKKKPIPQKMIDKELREYELANFISVPSEFAKNTFINYEVNKNKIIKIPYGVDLNQFYAKKNKSNIFRILSVGSVSIRKGSIYLLKAFNELNLPNSELVFAGNIEHEMENIIKPYKWNDNIKFLNHIPQKNLTEIYNNSDLFIICSIEEGMAMVQAQAMACGLPVICSENSGGAEIVDDGINGYICPIRNVDFLKEKIIKLYEDRTKLEEFSVNAEKKAKEKLSWDIYGENISKQYYELLNNFSEISRA